MTWSRDDTPGHTGALIGLVDVRRGDPRARFGDRFRELTEADAGPCYPDAVQVACTCGWRSARLEAPIDCCWWPARVLAPDTWALETSTWFEGLTKKIWQAHADAPTLGDQASARVRASG